MTAVAERPAPPAPGRVAAAGKPAGRRVDAVSILTVWLVLLMGIPASLVVAPLGAVGGPATIFAAVVLILYLVTWLHPALAPARGRQPVRAAAILLTCAVIGTYVSANRHIMPGLERNGIDRGIILICGWLGVLIMASDGIPSLERLKKLMGRVVIGATAMAILGITQFFTGLDATKYIIIPGLKQQSLNTDLLSRNGLNRPSATAAHPLEFAAVLAMALPFAINRARFAPPGKRGVRWLQVGLIGAALPISVSRSAVLALLAVAFILLPTWPKIERRIAYVVMGLGVVGLWMLVPGLVGTFRTLFATLTGDTSTTSRTSAFTTAMPYISQHPWFGHGFGTFFPATYFFTDDQYLLSLIEIGAVGLFALLALFVTGLVTAQRVRRATKDPEMRDLGQCLTATIAVAMVAFGTFDALSFNMAAGLTFLFLGCTGAALRLLKAQGTQADGHLAGQLMMQPDQEPPALTHRPRPDGPAGRGAAGSLYGVAGLRAGQQRNGHVSTPDERQPGEKRSEQEPNGHRPPSAGQRPEESAGSRQKDRVGAQVEKLIDRYLGEHAVGQPQEEADGHPAEPAGAAPEQPAGAAEQPAEAAVKQPAEAASQEPAQAQVEQPDQPYWENQLWPWEPKDLQPGPDQEEQPAGTREEQSAEAGHEEPAQEQQPAQAQAEKPEAQGGQQVAQAEKPTAAEAERPAEAEAERPTEAQAEQPVEAQAEQPVEAQAEVPDLPAGRPTVQMVVPDLPAGRPTVQMVVPDLPAGRPTVPMEHPAESQAEQPAARAERPAEAQTERPAEERWDPWRKANQPTDQPAADEQAAAPISRPTAEPAEAQAEQRAEERWDPWRKAAQATDQPAAAAPDEQTATDQSATDRPTVAIPGQQAGLDKQPAADRPTVAIPGQETGPDMRPAADRPTAEIPGQQAPELANQAAPEPASGRPEETTIPIPIIRD